MSFNVDEDVIQGLDIDKLLSGLPNLLSKLDNNDGEDSVYLFCRPKDKTEMKISVDTTVHVDGTKTFEHSKEYRSPRVTSSEARNIKHNKRIYYPMDDPGYALIISNKTFKTLKERSGTEVDAKGMKELLEYLNFNVTIYRDLTANEMTYYLSQAAGKDYGSTSALIIVILTHGAKGGALCGSDDQYIYVNDIEDMFSKTSTLRLKPKIFIIQACRGEAKGSEGSSDEAWVSQDNILKQKKYTLPTDKGNFLFAYSTLSGYVSWRHSLCGSWFISILITIFKLNAHRDHIVDMLTKTNQQLSLKTGSKNEKQICEYKSTLFYKLYFKPALKHCIITD